MTAALLLQLVHALAGLVVLAEALNKLERTDPLAAGACTHQRLAEVLKALAWSMLALGAGGAVAAPLLLSLGIDAVPHHWARPEQPTLAEVLVMAGFAVLIVRTRIKEGRHHASDQQLDAGR